METPVKDHLTRLGRAVCPLCALLPLSLSPALALPKSPGAQLSPPESAIAPLEGLSETLNQLEVRALHLLISHAELPKYKPSGAPWDYGSGAPDALFVVSYPRLSPSSLGSAPPWERRAEQLTVESELVRDEYMPVWLRSLSFVDLIEAGRSGLKLELYDQDPIGRQWIDSFVITPPSADQIGRLLSQRGAGGARIFFEWRPLARAREVTDVSAIAAIDERLQEESVKPLSAADHREAQRLYRAHIKALLSGDHLGAQEALLLLSQRYAHTRYGRKALRLLAPQAR